MKPPITEEMSNRFEVPRDAILTMVESLYRVGRDHPREETLWTMIADLRKAGFTITPRDDRSDEINRWWNTVRSVV